MVHPLELLNNDNPPAKSVWSNFWGPVYCGAIGFAGACLMNYGTRRPMFSGMQVHALATLAGAGIGRTLDNWRNDYLAEKDAVLRHYIELHPDDFPAPERKRWGDLLEEWVPIR